MSRVDMDMLDMFKKLYFGHKIIYVRFLSEDFVFRTLGRAEYKHIYKRYASSMDIQDVICNVACLYPEGYDFSTCGFAGLPDYCSDIIEELSGFKDVKSIIDDYKEMKEHVTLETQAMDLIKAFLPEYEYADMEEWTWEKLMRTVVKAESVAKLKGFDWHLEDKSEEFEENMNRINSDNKKFIDELYNNGVDPMYYFEDEIKELIKRPILDFPLISSGKWYDEELLDVIRKQSVNGRRPEYP